VSECRLNCAFVVILVGQHTVFYFDDIRLVNEACNLPPLENDAGFISEPRPTCAPGFSGYDCRTNDCPETCQRNGRCEAGSCVECNANFHGAACELTCDAQCMEHGRCDDGVAGSGSCICQAGWTGLTCQECSPGYFGVNCTLCSCEHGGVCADGNAGNGTCACLDGFGGANCEETIPSVSTIVRLDGGTDSVPTSAVPDRDVQLTPDSTVEDKDRSVSIGFQIFPSVIVLVLLVVIILYFE
jgi:hypothetical protein